MIEKKDKKELAGVKGWLLFFEVVFLFMFPFISINKLFLHMFASSDDLWFYKIIHASVGLFSFLTGIFILIRSSKTKIILQLFLLFYLLNSIPSNAVNQDLINQIIKIIFVIAIITIIYLYFRDSVRVRKTLIR